VRAEAEEEEIGERVAGVSPIADLLQEKEGPIIKEERTMGEAEAEAEVEVEVGLQGRRVQVNAFSL
jgi:hypothetical protein